MFARIAINIPALAGVFDYSIPNELAHVQVGCLVMVEFGKQTVQGVILKLSESASVANPKPILDLLDPAPVLTQPQIALAIRLAESTLNPLAAMVGLFLPIGLSQQADVLYELRNVGYEDKTHAVATRLLNLLHERGLLRGRQIDSHFAKVDWRKSAQVLVKKGVLSTKNVLPPPRVRPKYIRVAQLSASPQEAEEQINSLGSTKQTRARREAALRFLIGQPEAINVSWVYAQTGCTLADLQELEERGLIRLFESEIFRDAVNEMSKRKKVDNAVQDIELTNEQEIALKEIVNAISQDTKHPAFLLHGVTSSGKTEIYLRAAQETIRRGKQVLVLVPEIALTPQIVQRFVARFPGQVGLVHSKLSEGERYDTWRRARSGQLKVIIGPRSALFSPLPSIGLIVIDECHDSSYYQAEIPFYHAVIAAQEYARLCGAVCVMGSATPTIEQRYQSEHGSIQKLELSRRIGDYDLPPVQIVDMRAELKAGQRGIFSNALIESLAETIARKEQAILFLNRRGTATYIFCRECGYVLKCPNCETPLTLHLDGKAQLICHHCGYTRQRPKTCLQCNGTQIREYGLGSEKVEAEVQAIFPKVRTLRWDWETTRQKDSHEMILTHFANHQADVLVGTQMLAKGLDLPLVTLVGIVLADVGLSLPDPFASERVFQTLTQVAGRAGRSERGGKVVMQTFIPDHYAIQAASLHDVNGFYIEELDYRKRLGYPPFAKLVRMETRHTDPARAEAEARITANRLKARLEALKMAQTELIGPVPSFFAKVDSEFRWQILLRGPNPISVLREEKFTGWRIEADPINLL